MKLRIRGNSLRLRLQQGEVQRFAECGVLHEEIELAGARLRYGVRAQPALTAPVASLDAHTLEVGLPMEWVRRWAQTDQVTLRAEQALPGGGMLSLLIEKDFACLEPRPGEDDADAFPNPLEKVTGAGCKNE